jgi:hypothetical protein
MNNTKSLAENGVTKIRHQLRFPEFTEDGKTSHPLAGQKKFKDNGEAIWSKNHCLMYTAEAYRAMRSEATGLSSKETVYAIYWSEVPVSLQNLLAQKFPRKGAEYPEFTPKSLGFLLRKGSKPEKGQKRHAWAGIDVVVSGKYGDDQVVITGAYVMFRPGTVARLAANLNIPCPEWNREEKAEAPQEQQEELKQAASGLEAMKAALEDCGF